VLEAAASGLAVSKAAAYEPPYVDDGQGSAAEHEGRLRRLLAEGHRPGAVRYFMRSMVGVPAPFVVMMQLMPWVWPKMKAVAHTLPYDAEVMTGFKVPRERLAAIRIPTLVMHGSKTDVRIQKAAKAVAEAVPQAQHRILAGQTHNVAPAVLAAAVVEFFGS
jgi:pimeloyl-ACP methyl ester carboxylesterase